MLKKIIKYVDFNDQDRTQEFYFYLSPKDIKMLNAEYEGGISGVFTRMINNLDGKLILQTVEDIVLAAYGEKSADGTRFIKNDKIKEDFKYSAAYEKLFDELTEDPDAFSDFFKKVLPNDVQKRIDEANAKGEVPMPEIAAEVLKDFEKDNNKE